LVLACGLTACGDDDDSGSSKPHGMKDAGGGSHHEDAGDSTDAATDAASGDAAMMIVDAGPPPAADLDELIGLGIADYLGKAKPTKHETITGQAGVAEGSVVYDFDEKDGPVCFRGAPYNASILDQGSDNLMIYMQGGGACLSLICQATTEATPRGVPKLGVLDTTDDDNPVGSWNILYVPYCDGSVFGGDLDYVNPDDDTDVRKHHGVKNFSAALDLAIEHFPHPKKVLLTGSSAGGWGTIYHRALVRHVYPDAQISVFDDAGIGFSVNSDYVSSEWGSAKRSRPPSCKECQTDANLSQYVKYLLEHDPGTVVGDFSAWEDSVIMQFTFTSNPQTFRMHLQDATDIPAKAYPDRYKRFFINGSMHTTLLNAFHTTKVGDVNVSDWLGMMIDRDPKWKDEIE
jgi:hypothetical protein